MVGINVQLNGGVCKVQNTDLPPDDLRKSVTDLFNGYYTTMICRGCGIYYVDPDGNYLTAKIVDKCKICFEPQ